MEKEINKKTYYPVWYSRQDWREIEAGNIPFLPGYTGYMENAGALGASVRDNLKAINDRLVVKSSYNKAIEMGKVFFSLSSEKSGQLTGNTRAIGARIKMVGRLITESAVSGKIEISAKQAEYLGGLLVLVGDWTKPVAVKMSRDRFKEIKATIKGLKLAGHTQATALELLQSAGQVSELEIQEFKKKLEEEKIKEAAKKAAE